MMRVVAATKRNFPGAAYVTKTPPYDAIPVMETCSAAAASGIWLPCVFIDIPRHDIQILCTNSEKYIYSCENMTKS